MLRGLISLFLAVSCGAVPAFATNITADTSSSGGEANLEILRGMAEAMIKESRGHTTISEGEELIVRPGGKTERTTIDTAAEQEKWQAGLSSLGGSVATQDIPDLLMALRQSQGENLKSMQNMFKSLLGKPGISMEEKQEFLKNIERQIGVITEDKAILDGLQLRITTLMSGPATSPSQMSELNQLLKMVGDTQNTLLSYQSESTKMFRMEFKTSSPEISAEEKQNQIVETAASIGTEVTGLATEVSGRGSLSQDWFKEGADRLNNSLKELGHLEEQTQALLTADPKNAGLLATLKQLKSQISQASGLLRDFVVVEVPASVITEIRDRNESASDQLAAIKSDAEYIKKNGATKEQLDTLFLRYDEMKESYETAQKLVDTTLRSAPGQKYLTTEQRELYSAWNLLAETFRTFGFADSQLGSADRDKIWSAYLKEKKETETAAQSAPAKFELINDVISGTLLPGKPYLPITPAAAHPDVATRLSDAVIGDVLVKDNVSYGVAIKKIDNSSGDLNTGLLNGAVLVAFMIKDGVYTERNVTSPVNIYDGATNTALGWGASGELLLFVNHTGSDNTHMTGTLYSLDKDTLVSSSNSDLFSDGNQGWYPRVTEDGEVAYTSIDINGGEHACSNIVCHEFKELTDAIKAGHSNFIFNTAANPDKLPTEVVANRLSGANEATPLGTYSYLSWGRWNDGALVADTIYTNSPWIAGSLTDGANIPVTGSASYSGKVLGKLNEGGTISGIGGTSALTAKFAEHTLTGNFNMTRNDAAWTNAAVTAGWGAGKNNITGTLAADNNMTGAVSGNFFGPAVNQVGGSWNLQNSGGRAAGVFTGNKQ